MTRNERIALKKEWISLCVAKLQAQKDNINRGIEEVFRSLSSETKSTAGDKHETGRAMLQLKREQLGVQLARIDAELAILNRINPALTHEQVHFGSVVFTASARFFIATSVGEVHMQEGCFIAISAKTPMAAALLGKKAGDSLFFNGKKLSIQDCF